MLADDFWNWQERRSILLGTIVGSTADCAKSHVVLDHSDLKYVSAHGRPLIADVGGSDSDGLYTMIDASGTVRGNLGGPMFSYGYELPPAYMSGLKKLSGALLINNAEILAVTLSGSGGGQRVLAVKKRDRTWHRVPLPPTTRSLDATVPTAFPVMRGFGHFIAMAEALPKGVQNPESAGGSEWKRIRGQAGPDIGFLFRDAKVVFPGRLHVFDVDTERSYTIDTKQGDSEVLLVESGTVYYRASDRLYAASITEEGIGPARLLAKAEEIRDAHWAFIKH